MLPSFIDPTEDALKLQFYYLLTVKKKSFEPNCFSKNHDTCVSHLWQAIVGKKDFFFSELKRNQVWTMRQDRLNNWTLTSLEYELLCEVDISYIIDKESRNYQF